MSGLDEVDCTGCGRRHVTNGEQARKERVLRCDCGRFVRLDRASATRRSEPAPPPPIEILRAGSAQARDEDEEDDATHMLSSLAAVAAVSGRGRSRSPQPSLVDDERVSRPVERPSTLRSTPPAPARQPSIAPTDKPLWYVDLGGTELVEMTIEQLIVARRTGKLGEGALVWREGMPGWRPVGTLIPAASASSHPSPMPAASSTSTPSRPAPAIRTPLPSRPPPPKRPPPPNPAPEEATPQSLASYERPLATLEFALEKPETTPLRAPNRSALPSDDSSASALSRPPTPLPRASLSAFSTPFPRSAQLPLVAPLATRTPFPPARTSALPPAPPPPAASASPSPIPAAPVAPAARASDSPSQQAALANLQAADAQSERPRWVSACIALIVCITASAAGASLVRSLKQHPKSQVLPIRALPAPVNTPVVAQRSEPPAAASSSAPLVVDLESLSVEHKHTPVRVVRATPKPAASESADTSDEATTPANDSALESTPAETPKSSDLPAEKRESHYGSGSLIDQIKKATADEEAGQ
jgi:hypothetical protein